VTDSVTGQNLEPEPITTLVTDSSYSQAEKNIKNEAQENFDEISSIEVSINPSPENKPLPVKVPDPSPQPSPQPSSIRHPKILELGDRVKITEDYPGSETLRGIEATVRADLGKRGFEIEFDAEVEIVGGKPKKSLVVSAEFLALIPAAPVPTKKVPTKIKVGDRVAIKDVGGRYAGTKGTVSKVIAEDKYYIDYDKAVGSSKFGLWPASELWKLPN
jgi:hypothetical protein